MLERDRKREHFSVVVQLSVVAIGLMVLAVETAAAQDPALAVPQNAVATTVIPLGRVFGDGLSFSTAASAGSGRWPVSDAPAGEFAGRAASTQGNPILSGGIRRTRTGQAAAICEPGY